MNPSGKKTLDDSFFVGLDLGQASEFTALAVVEQTRLSDPGRDPMESANWLDDELYLPPEEHLPMNVPGNPAPHVSYLVGLDLGQVQEFTALAVVERTRLPDPDDDGRKVSQYAVRHLHRFSMGTAYPAILTHLSELLGRPPLTDSTLVVDQTAAGRPVVRMLSRALEVSIRAVTITAGHEATRDDHAGWLVPKKELVSTMQLLLQSQRLQIASSLPEAPVLADELRNFKAKPAPTNGDDLVDWRERPHDDLVLATAIAVWEGERTHPLSEWIALFMPVVRPTPIQFEKVAGIRL